MTGRRPACGAFCALVAAIQVSCDHGAPEPLDEDTTVRVSDQYVIRSRDQHQYARIEAVAVNLAPKHLLFRGCGSRSLESRLRLAAPPHAIVYTQYCAIGSPTYDLAPGDTLRTVLTVYLEGPNTPKPTLAKEWLGRPLVLEVRVAEEVRQLAPDADTAYLTSRPFTIVRR